jgi:hypothetical protein
MHISSHKRQMNCKLNDRAIVTRVRPASAPGKDAAIKAMLGHIVKVVRSYHQDGLPFWELEETVPLPDLCFQVSGIEDYCLTPIRDQLTGDDVRELACDPLTIFEPGAA